MKWYYKRDCPHFYLSGLTLVELIMVIAILALLTSGVWLSFRVFLAGRSLEATAENLANLIRTAQASAKETESAQIILLAKEEAVWIRSGEIIRRQKFKNEVQIEELEIKGSSLEVPDDPIENTGIIIDEKGNADHATIFLAKDKENIIVSAGGSIVTSGGGSLGVLDANVAVIPVEAGIQQSEDALIVQTEPLQARGWQVITVNNVDKVKEVKLRVKLDSRLPTSAHLHAYVFPGWYENKPVAHGVTGQQTMLDEEYKKGTVPNFYGIKQNTRDCPLFKGEVTLYRESTSDCLAFFSNNYTVSGTLTNELGIPIAGMRMFLTGNSNENGSYSLIYNSAAAMTVYPSSNYTLNSFIYYSKPPSYTFPYDTTLNQIANFMLYRNATFTINGYVKEPNGTPVANVALTVEHISIDYTNYGITMDRDTNAYSGVVNSEENGFYSIASIPADHYWSIKLKRPGYIFIPESVTLFFNSNKNMDFTGVVSTAENPFGSDKYPLGIWNYPESQLKNSAIAISVPVLANAAGYYIYKNKTEVISQPFVFHNTTQSLQMYNEITRQTPRISLIPERVSDNTLNPGSDSDFATKTAILVYANQINSDNAYWEQRNPAGFVQSVFAGQVTHTPTGSNEETHQSEYSHWLTIPINSFPKETKFLRIAIALYRYDTNREQLFNLYPTASSTANYVSTIPTGQLDYETDPFIVYYPWKNWINDPFWLSHYAYALKSTLRPYGVNVLANKGPITEENYRNTGGFYKGFWYGPLYLDWDLILGNENIYQLLGQVSSTFELNSNRWRFRQEGDTYGNTTLAPPSHYLLKNFAYLSYWYLFNYLAYSQQPSIYSLPKRFQEPLNLGRTNISSVNNWLKLFERQDPYSYSVPWESSSLSIPFINNPRYPIWLANLPGIFGQGRISSAPDLYSSYYYLQERINHTMLDIGVWTIITNPNQTHRDIISRNIFGFTVLAGPALHTSYRIGNFESWSVGGDTMAAWWQWYEKIPWAKGQAFPRKTGPNPTDFKERIGWEKPVITQPSSYWDYFASSLASLNYRDNPTDSSYNTREVVHAPHTIFMSTSHYPLGIIQIAVKK